LYLFIFINTQKEGFFPLRHKVFPKVALVSLGCPKNLVDSEVALGYLQQAGFTFTFDESEADVLIVNTCSFIEDAKQESVETILELAEEKRREPVRARLLVVAGCLAQNFGEELLQQVPEIDLVIGTGMVSMIGQICREALDGKLVQSVWIDEPTFLYTEKTPRIRATLPHVAYVKIAEGCNNCCSYCLIPRLRGKLRSRTEDSIVAECQSLTMQGVKEINLIAQDTTAYGLDLPSSPLGHVGPLGTIGPFGHGEHDKDKPDKPDEPDKPDKYDKRDKLVPLLRRLVKVDGLRWIRLLYTYPDSITRELLTCIAEEPKICKYVDMPIQHINDTILHAMNRRSSRKSIEAAVALIREIIPDAIIRTSLMVGFPGEGKKQFEELRDFVAYAQFDRLGVFSFSPQEETPAARLAGKVSQKIKEQRRNEILQLQAEISARKNHQLIGTCQEVIIDQIGQIENEGENSAGTAVIGRTRGHAPDIDGLVYLTPNRHCAAGEIVPVRIIRAEAYDLFAEFLNIG
jgi:ribosomal protein S12 methylthiotransferase